MVNFYELLGIESNATNDEINKAYRKKSLVFHPDTNNGSPASDAMFKLIVLAKDTLLDPNKRLEHDYTVGLKVRPVPKPKIVEVPVEKVVRKSNVGEIIGWGLLAFIVGAALGGSSGDSKS